MTPALMCSDVAIAPDERPDEPLWSSEEPRGEPTLEDLLASVWDELHAGHTVACPVCRAPMRPRWSAGAGVVGGRCDGCGTELS